MIRSSNSAVTIVVVCYNEERNIARCLSSLCDQETNFLYDIVVVDGMSNDATLSIVDEFIQMHGNIRLERNQKRYISAGRNIGWKEAKTELVAFIDADCAAPSNWIQSMLEAYYRIKEKETVAIVIGGGNYPPDNKMFYRALRIFFGSFLGNRGSIQTQMFTEMLEVPHIPTLNILYERSSLICVDGFDEARFPLVGEDEDVSVRIREGGGKIFYIPNCDVAHYQKDSIGSWARNMWSYGYGRILLIKRHPQIRRLRDLLPMFVPLSVIGLALSPFLIYLAIPIVLYIGLMMAFSIFDTLVKKKIDCFPYVFLLFIVTHFFYGTGMLQGLFHNTDSRQ